MSPSLRHVLILLVAAACCPALLRAERASARRAAAERPPGLEAAKKAELPDWRPADLRLDRIRLPPGFEIELYTDESTFIPTRFLALGRADEEATIVFASTSEESAVFAIVDRGDGKRTACVLLQGLNQPNGITYDAATGSLYVAAVRGGGGFAWPGAGQGRRRRCARASPM